MFSKQNKKAIVKFSFSSEGFSGSGTSVALNDSKLLGYLKNKLDRHGELVIRHISNDNEIHLTSSRTVDYNNTESRIDELNDVIRDYIQNKAISMEAHAVLVEGELKGVFGDDTKARLKRQSLIKKGISSEKIEIKTIEVNNFQDIE